MQCKKSKPQNLTLQIEFHMVHFMGSPSSTLCSNHLCGDDVSPRGSGSNWPRAVHKLLQELLSGAQLSCLSDPPASTGHRGTVSPRAPHYLALILWPVGNWSYYVPAASIHNWPFVALSSSCLCSPIPAVSAALHISVTTARFNSTETKACQKFTIWN